MLSYCECLYLNIIENLVGPLKRSLCYLSEWPWNTTQLRTIAPVSDKVCHNIRVLIPSEKIRCHENSFGELANYNKTITRLLGHSLYCCTRNIVPPEGGDISNRRIVNVIFYFSSVPEWIHKQNRSYQHDSDEILLFRFIFHVFWHTTFKKMFYG